MVKRVNQEDEKNTRARMETISKAKTKLGGDYPKKQYKYKYKLYISWSYVIKNTIEAE